MNPREESESLILAGPTGVGKTQVAVELARRRGLELISADSMQVYRGLEIGTAQPTPDELRGVKLHGCGVISPNEPFNVKRFLDLADSARERVLAAGAHPLYVGGTGMYLRALRWGLLDHPAPAPGLRESLNNELKAEGPAALHARLARTDSEQATKISLNDGVRIVRALEVAETAGRPLSELQREWDRARPRFAHRLIILNCPRPALVKRIESRMEAMLKAGWVDEVRRLLAAGHARELHCFKALGYREIIDHLAGELERDEMIERVKARTRQFSKRQMTWFRKETPAEWIEFDGFDMEQIVSEIEKTLA